MDTDGEAARTLAAWRTPSYVGDAGATEPNRPTTRRGVEWNNRWIPLPWLLVDADLAKESARLQALQTKQQLGIQALHIANSNSENVLVLFR